MLTYPGVERDEGIFKCFKWQSDIYQDAWNREYKMSKLISVSLKCISGGNGFRISRDIKQKVGNT